MSVESANRTIERWGRHKYYGDEYNRSLMLRSYEFRHYKLNIFILNSMALKIQHSYFKVRAGIRRIVASKVKKQIKTMSKSFLSNSRATPTPSTKSGKLSYSKTSTRKMSMSKKESFIKDTTQKKISTDRNKSKPALSRPSTSERGHKAKPSLLKQPTITDNQLKCVVNKAWAEAETEKQKKLRQLHKPKRAPLRSQESINEEILVSKILQKAYIEADEIKKHKDHSAQKKPQKAPKMHSQESIAEENLVKGIVNNAWNTVDHEQRRPSKSPNKKPRAELHTQASIDEENFVKGLVANAYHKVEDQRHSHLKNSGSKPHKPKTPLRSQESINEERLVACIVSDAYSKAEQLKKDTIKQRKQVEKKKHMPKFHSQQSIMEEQEYKKIVNSAWNEVHQTTPSKPQLHHIYENDMENESSFDDSDNSEVAPTPKAIEVETRKTRTMTTQSQAETHASQKVRRSRANRSKDHTSSKAGGRVLQQANYNSINVSQNKKSPFKETNTNIESSLTQTFKINRNKQIIEVTNLDPNFNEEDLLISPVKENRDLLFESYLNDDF